MSNKRLSVHSADAMGASSFPDARLRLMEISSGSHGGWIETSMRTAEVVSTVMSKVFSMPWLIHSVTAGLTVTSLETVFGTKSSNRSPMWSAAAFCASAVAVRSEEVGDQGQTGSDCCGCSSRFSKNVEQDDGLPSPTLEARSFSKKVPAPTNISRESVPRASNVWLAPRVHNSMVNSTSEDESFTRTRRGSSTLSFSVCWPLSGTTYSESRSTCSSAWGARRSGGGTRVDVQSH
mmetsp:Transcript_2735/g.10731  ORF Transcript_2735/g.10731 Transcript_2735/m.10731 type:complete len:235 (-) Transcript_2735:2187-2891(-)